ncbi:helix-turn-helix domain-containing protein [Mycolicibacterium baixiangningiae]|uniref:helix-turn-helix domain-containing protein n=1 Tax=Mycolicibacterium baixiangningiae TaxID=2761578 RepID=UPI0018CFFFCA|nr:helix-turn-helix domain-containing protein [Mycolicibacterium baixiangningiae]
MTLLKIIEGDSEFHPAAGSSRDGFFESVEADLLERVETIAREVNQGQDFDAVLQGLATAVARTSPWSMCGVELYAADDNRLVTWACDGFNPSAAEVFDQWPSDGDPSATAARRNRVVTIPDVSKAHEFPHTRREAIRTGFRSAMYVPMRLADYVAVLSLCRPDAHDFTPAELSQAGALASVVAVALESAIKTRDPLASDDWTAARSDNDLQRHAAAHDRLLHLQVSGATLNELCKGISDLLGLPVLFTDRFQQTLGFAQMTPRDAADLGTWLSGKKQTRPDGRGLVCLTEGPRKVLVGHAYDGPNRLGSVIAVLPSDDHSRQAIAQTLELACIHVTLALLRQRTAIETEVRMRQDFGEALGSMNTTGLALAQLAAVLGIGMDSPHRVMRVHPEGLRRPLSPHDAYEVAELLSKRLAQIGVSAVVSPVGGVDFVLILREQEDRRGAVTPTQVVRAGIRDALSALHGAASASVAIAIGTGNAGVGVEALDRSHREARRALEVARSMDGDESERHIADVGSYAVLTATWATTPADQDLFVRRYLEPLMDYDRIHNAGYVETLQTYFENVGNVQRTADKLYLHLSTVRYRLKRIEEIAEIDLREEEDRLCMQLALRLVRFSGSARSIG